MALEFSKYEPVGFGDFHAMPEVNPEKRLRLQAIKITENNLDEARELLASCFGDNAAKVSAFMKANMFLRDFFELRAYLLGGSSGLTEYRNQVSRLMDAKIDEALANMTDEGIVDV